MIELSVIRDLVAIFGVIAGFSYYVLTVQNSRRNQELQLQTRQAQLFMQSMNNIYSPYMQAQLKILYSSWDASDDDWLDRYYSDYEFRKAFDDYIQFWESIGVLIKKEYMDIELLALYSATATINTWERYRDIIYKFRKANKRAGDMWEYTYDTLMAYLEEHPELIPGPSASPLM